MSSEDDLKKLNEIPCDEIQGVIYKLLRDVSDARKERNEFLGLVPRVEHLEKEVHSIKVDVSSAKDDIQGILDKLNDKLPILDKIESYLKPAFWQKIIIIFLSAYVLKDSPEIFKAIVSLF